MRVLCIANTGAGLPNHFRHSVENDGTSFSPLKVGEAYAVYGLKFRSNRVDYLVYPVAHDSDWSHGPGWKPGPLFKIKDPMLPPWKICLTDQQPGFEPLLTQYGITALIGYDELVSNPAHYDGILERDHDELCKFFVERTKIDEFERYDE